MEVGLQNLHVRTAPSTVSAEDSDAVHNWRLVLSGSEACVSQGTAATVLPGTAVMQSTCMLAQRKRLDWRALYRPVHRPPPSEAHGLRTMMRQCVVPFDVSLAL